MKTQGKEPSYTMTTIMASKAKDFDHQDPPVLITRTLYKMQMSDICVTQRASSQSIVSGLEF